MVEDKVHYTGTVHEIAELRERLGTLSEQHAKCAGLLSAEQKVMKLL